jgi:Chaperone of endosialidase
VNKHQLCTVAWAVSAVLAASVAFGQEPIAPAPPANLEPLIPPRPVKEFAPPQIPHTAVPAIPDEEVESGQASSSSVGISPMPAAGTTLSPPVTITYSGSSNAVTIKDGGTNRGLSSSLTNSSNGNSAVYGATSGSGAGVKGINSGTTGSGGMFEVTDSASTQPALSASTAGTGSAIVATITKALNVNAAIFGQNSVSEGLGSGVQGLGNFAGLYGVGAEDGSFGVFGQGGSGGTGVEGFNQSGIGVKGFSQSDYGVFGTSDISVGVYGSSATSEGVYANSLQGPGLYADSVSGSGVVAHSRTAIGVYSSSDTNYGVWGQSHNEYGVIGEDSGSGIGVYGASATGYAGYFAGKVGATKFVTLSDRNAKTEIAAIDGSDILERVSRLPITSWSFKSDPKVRHVGPMAQDFHAAFGLDGDDDTHINLADAAGVSLVAIQELNKRLKQKDAQIARNDARIAELEAKLNLFSARMAKLEQHAAGSAETVTASLQSGARVSTRVGGQD